MYDLQNGGGFLFEGQDFGVLDSGACPDLAGRALANSDGFSWLIQILQGVNIAVLGDQKGKACREIGIRKGDGGTALRRIRHGRYNTVDLVRLERGNETCEGNVLDAHRPAERLPERLGNIHTHTLGFSGGSDCFKRRIGKIHSDDQRRLVAALTAAQGPRSEENQRYRK